MENQPTISSDLIRGHIDTIILHTLIESDKFAQQISDAVENKSGNEYKINQATLYSSLKRLESLKLVESYWHDYDDGRRKFFKITDLGKQTVENNLSSWTYSRSIIDKLMNLSPTPVFISKNVSDTPIQTQTVENRFSEQNNNLIDVVNTEKTEKTIENVQPATENAEISVEKPSENAYEEKSENNDHERNFRNILNGLVQISMQTTHDEPEHNVLEPIVTETEENKVGSDVMKFNETIDETDYNANKSNFNGKIDYGDLTLKAEKEGYTIRISSKDSAKPLGKLLINKLNFVVSALVFATCLIELGVLYLLFSNAFSAPSVIVLSAVSVIPVVAFGIIYLSRRDKLYKKKILPDGILTAAIVAFNLILINFAIDFLFEIDFSSATVLLAALIIPIVYYADLVLFFALRYYLSPCKPFNNKNKS